MPRKRKKERYIDRWRREHKEVRLYLKKEEYEVLERLASRHNMSVREYILKFINNTEEAFKRGYGEALKEFIEEPHKFYNAVRAIYDGDIALFEVPCSICGKPMIFDHKDEKWEFMKKILLHAFKNWSHNHCAKSIPQHLDDLDC